MQMARGPRSLEKVSLCMIVRDEETNLPHCLRPVSDLFDEMVVVDTGSTDRTREIAAQWGARVYDFPWSDDFSAARNCSLEHVTGQWIFWLDADDRVDAENRDRLQRLMSNLADDQVAYSMKCHAIGPEPGKCVVLHHPRLFRRHAAIRWRYRVHEQIMPALMAANVRVEKSNVTIRHVGYEQPMLHRAKVLRNLRLLQLDHADNPSDPCTLLHLGMAWQLLGDAENAIICWERCKQALSADEPLLARIFTGLVVAHRQLGDRQAALNAARSGLARFPDEPELMFLEAQGLIELDRRSEARHGFERLLSSTAPAKSAGVDAQLRPKAFYNLALVDLRDRRRWDAVASLRACLREMPDFIPARDLLNQLSFNSALSFQEGFA